MELLTESTKATHDDDFSEHLGMDRLRTWKGKTAYGKVDPHSFTHHYGVRAGEQPHDSAHTFHGVMAYYGHKKEKSPSPDTIHYSGTEDRNGTKVHHQYHAHLDHHGGVRFIAHKEHFDLKEGVNEMKTYDGKPLRSIVPKSFTPTAYQATAPSEKDANEKFFKAGVGKGEAFPNRQGNDDDFATKKSPKAKHPAPDVGTKVDTQKLKNDTSKLTSDKELVEDVLNEMTPGAKVKLNGWMKDHKQYGQHGHVLKGSGTQMFHIKWADGTKTFQHHSHVERVKDDKKPVQESDEVNELERKTVKSYMKKSARSQERAGDKMDREEDKAMSTDGYKYPDKQARHNANAAVAHKVWLKRNKGQEMAKARLGEEEQIDELSRKTLASYTKKAADSMGQNDRMAHTNDVAASKSTNPDYKEQLHGRADNFRNKYFKRRDGISKATDKLAKD